MASRCGSRPAWAAPSPSTNAAGRCRSGWSNRAGPSPCRPGARAHIQLRRDGVPDRLERGAAARARAPAAAALGGAALHRGPGRLPAAPGVARVARPTRRPRAVAGAPGPRRALLALPAGSARAGAAAGGGRAGRPALTPAAVVRQERPRGRAGKPPGARRGRATTALARREEIRSSGILGLLRPGETPPSPGCSSAAPPSDTTSTRSSPTSTGSQIADAHGVGGLSNPRDRRAGRPGDHRGGAAPHHRRRPRLAGRPPLRRGGLAAGRPPHPRPGDRRRRVDRRCRARWTGRSSAASCAATSTRSATATSRSCPARPPSPAAWPSGSPSPPAAQVAAAVVDSSSLDSARLQSCTLQAVRRWTFPQPQGGGIVIATYPFTFVPAGQTPMGAAPASRGPWPCRHSRRSRGIHRRRGCG